MSTEEKEKIKTDAITELFNSKNLHEKVNTICYKHRIPLDCDIQSDILQVAFEHLWKYDTDKFIEAYQDNPNRILGLGVTLALRKGVYLDKRTSKSWSHSIAQQIIHQSTLNTLQHISSTNDKEDDYNLPQYQIDNNVLEEERYEENMWIYIRENIDEYENMILDIILNPEPIKLKGKLKKDYVKLLPKLKSIIIEYKNQN